MKMKKLQRNSRFPALWTWSGIAAASESPTAAKVGWFMLKVEVFCTLQLQGMKISLP